MKGIDNNILIETASERTGESTLIPMIADDDQDYLKVIQENPDVPLLPLRNVVLFPGVVLPISVGRKKSLKLVREVFKSNGVIGAVAQKDGLVEEPTEEDLFKVGTIAQILRILEMPD